MAWIITSTTEIDDETGEGLLWSNTEGWISGDNYDTFTNEEKETMNLPIGGQWEQVLWDVKVQPKKTFKVTFSRKIWETVTVHVEATDEDAAEDIASMITDDALDAMTSWVQEGWNPEDYIEIENVEEVEQLTDEEAIILAAQEQDELDAVRMSGDPDEENADAA